MASSSSFPSAAVLVARYLKSHQYNETLETFVREAKLSQCSISDTDNEHEDSTWTIEKLLEEKIAFDHSISYEKRDDNDGKRWSLPAPSTPTLISSISSANILSATIQPWKHAAKKQALIVSTSDRRLTILDPSMDSLPLMLSRTCKSPILSCMSLLGGRYLAVTNMEGVLDILDSKNLETVYSVRNHSRFAVMVTAYEEKEKDRIWLATAGWDGKVMIYKLNYDERNHLLPFEEGVSSNIEVASNPECILITRDQDTNNLILVLSRKDSQYLEYYLLDSPAQTEQQGEISYLGRQNLAPQSSAWTPFSPSHFKQCPTDPGLLAISTSSEPYMKILIVRMLTPSSPQSQEQERSDTLSTSFSNLSLSQYQSQSQTQTQLREDSAILMQCTAPAPQTPYSTPQIAWRADGSEVWINGEDGVVRGVDVGSGEVVAVLGGKGEKKGHEAGSKVRSVWAGMVCSTSEDGNEKEEEWVVTGGFDKRVIVWR